MTNAQASGARATSDSGPAPSRAKQAERADQADRADEVGVEMVGRVAVVEVRRQPHNFTDVRLLTQLADTVERLEAERSCGAVVLASGARSFSAGADFASGGLGDDPDEGFRGATRRFYDQALRLFRAGLPMVAAVHGPAVGAGVGLALACDLRVTCPEAWMAASFVRLGIHPGFGISVTLPELVGPARAADLLLTGRRVGGEEAVRLGLADRCVPRESVRDEAVRLAAEIAGGAPLAVRSVRATLRGGLADRVATALEHELDEQARLRETADAAEGVAATAERREPRFQGA